MPDTFDWVRQNVVVVTAASWAAVMLLVAIVDLVRGALVKEPKARVCGKDRDA